MENKTIDHYFENFTTWKDELNKLRSLMKGKSLEESIKWGRPCYSYNGKLIIGLSEFKNHYGIWFFHGALIEDNYNMLINAQEGKTKGMRQIRFDSTTKPVRGQIIYYIDAAIKNAKEGQFVKAQKKKLAIPTALKVSLKEDLSFEKAFHKMTESQRKEFAEYIAEAKRDTTVQSRLIKIKAMVTKGEGLNDKYRNKK